MKKKPNKDKYIENEIEAKTKVPEKSAKV